MDLVLELRKNGLEAVAILPPGPLDLEPLLRQVRQRLDDLGVVAAVDPATLRDALAPQAEPGAPGGEVVIARGVPPRPGLDGQVLLFLPERDTPLPDGADPFAAYPANIVYPGTPILQRTAPSAGLPGRNLLGEELPAPAGRNVSVSVGSGVTLGDDGTTFFAATYGVALFHRGVLRVAEAFHVDDDWMGARMTVLPDPRLDGGGLLDRVLATLETFGIQRGIDHPGLEEAVRAVRSTGSPVYDLVVARGELPVHGQEADYRLTFDPERKIGKTLAGDRIDFREAEVVQNVRKGDRLAEATPKIEPVPGFRVDGKVLDASLKRAEGLQPGENTVLAPDGAFVLADADGMVVLKGGKFHVADQYLVAGDVDYRSGNIRASGFVCVRGGVRPGFQVEAGKGIEVAGDVEEAVVEAAWDVEIRGGVTNGSRVAAGKSVLAKYILNSRVESGGDVEAKLSINNSEIYAKGKVRAVSGQGAIVGGEVNATMGVEARTIGAPASRTHIAVGVDLRVIRAIEAIDKERVTIPEAMKYLQASLGREFLRDPRAALLAIPAALRKPKLELLQKLKNLHEREAQLASEREALVQTNRDQQNARISVQLEIQAGTTLTVGLAKLTLPETLRRVDFYYAPETNSVAWRRG